MSETYTPSGNVGASLQRATSGEAATGTHGSEFMRDNPTKVADKIRYLKDSGLFAFPVTQVPDADPNVLDDYEEGTFTPTLSFGGASVGIAYASQQGGYVKIGRQVTVQIRVVLSSKGSSTGVVRISGLPFPASPSLYGNSTCPCYYTGLASINNSVIGVASNNSSVVDLYTGGAAGVAQLTEANFTNTSDLILTITYQV